MKTDISTVWINFCQLIGINKYLQIIIKSNYKLSDHNFNNGLQIHILERIFWCLVITYLSIKELKINFLISLCWCIFNLIWFIRYFALLYIIEFINCNEFQLNTTIVWLFFDTKEYYIQIHLTIRYLLYLCILL